MLKADKESEERELINRIPLVETNNNLVSSTEKNHSPDSSLAETIQSTGNATDYPVDSRMRDHTNNRIGESCEPLLNSVGGGGGTGQNRIL